MRSTLLGVAAATIALWAVQPPAQGAAQTPGQGRERGDASRRVRKSGIIGLEVEATGTLFARNIWLKKLS